MPHSSSDPRAELRSTTGMPRQKTSIIPLQDMMDDFLAFVAKSSKTIPNVFTNVPEFRAERDMCDYITERLNASGKFSRTGMTFVTTAYKPDQSDPSKQAIDCGMYASKTAPKEEYTESYNEASRRMIWALVELPVKCKLDVVSQDPFDESSEDEEAAIDMRREVLGQILSDVELAFKYQQRESVFMVLFIGRYARVVRFDRSGIIASEKIDYTKRGAELTEFLVRYARLGATNRGHDPSASRILPTDPLWQQLQQHGADAAERDPEDHVQKLFNQTLDPEWPWWKLSVPDEGSNVKRWFAVGKPHFYAGGVAGRGTRGYVAAPLIDDGKKTMKVDSEAKFVYLKDAWRVDHKGMEKEGTILKALNDAKVTYVPTLLYHGDLDQSTESYAKWLDYHEGRTQEDCPLKSHQHYRLVVAEVGKPLSEFENGLELVWALLCCIVAHEKACAAGYIHRDISAGNILLYQDETGHWAGLLNDWELSKKFVDGATDSEGGGRQLDRAGTWQFMSALALLDSSKLIEISDDLESFFHVLIYYAIRYLPHNLADNAVGRFLYSYFDDYTDGISGFTCGPAKYYAMQTGVIDLTLITDSTPDGQGKKIQSLQFLQLQCTTPSSSDNKEASENNEGVAAMAGHPINGLVTELLKAFRALYAKDVEQGPETPALADPSILPPAMDAMRKAQQATKAARNAPSRAKLASANDGSTVNLELAANVATHGAMQDLIMDHLYGSDWPKVDKGGDKKLHGGYVPAKENTAVGSTIQIGSKRGLEDGEVSMSLKRARNRVA